MGRMMDGNQVIEVGLVQRPRTDGVPAVKLPGLQRHPGTRGSDWKEGREVGEGREGGDGRGRRGGGVL